jgi:hypothetical protein
VQRYFARRFADERANRQMCSRCHARPHASEHQVRLRLPVIISLHQWQRPISPVHLDRAHVMRSATRGGSSSLLTGCFACARFVAMCK